MVLLGAGATHCGRVHPGDGAGHGFSTSPSASAGNGSARARLAAGVTTIGLIGSGTSAAPSRGSRSTPATTSCSATAADPRRSATWWPSSARTRGPPPRPRPRGRRHRRRDRAAEGLPRGARSSRCAARSSSTPTTTTPQRDGHIAELDDESTTASELLQAHLPESHVVKAFNNIYFAPPGSLQRPAGSPERSVLAIAGDDDAPRRRSPPSSTPSATTPTTSARSPRAGATSATPRPTSSPMPSPGTEYPRGRGVRSPRRC